MGHLLGYARVSTTDQQPQLQVAREMYGSEQSSVAAIATTLGVSRASIYRHLTRPGS